MDEKVPQAADHAVPKLTGGHFLGTNLFPVSSYGNSSTLNVIEMAVEDRSHGG